MLQCPYCSSEVSGFPLGESGKYAAGCVECLNAFAYNLDGQSAPICERLPDRADLRLKVYPDSVMGGVFAMLRQAMDDLPVLPEAPQRILALINDPLVNMEDLAAAIKEDAAIALKVLKLANSVWFRGRDDMTDLKLACSRLGLRNVANAVTAVAQGNLYRVRDPGLRTPMRLMWRHAVATAYCAEGVSKLSREVSAPDAFMGGLMHDIGKAVLLDLIVVKYRGSVGRLREDPELLMRVLDEFHTLVGLHVAQRWGLAPACRLAAFAHHGEAGLEELRQQPMTHLVALANALAHESGYGLDPDRENPFVTEAVRNESRSALGLEPVRFEAFCEGLQDRLAQVIDVYDAPLD